MEYMEYMHPLGILDLTPDEDIRLECRNVGSWLQFDWAL